MSKIAIENGSLTVDLPIHTNVYHTRYQFMITAGILAAAAADVFLVELEDGWRYAICLQVAAEHVGIQAANMGGFGWFV